MNEYLAAAVDELYLLGIRQIVISPGSRSTPLSMLFCERGFEVYLDIDERSAGFFALGIAKEKKHPVVLVCTSGSAVTHYLPAITEAKCSRIPLLIISADRPPELQNVAAPQTINQRNILGDYTNYFEELTIVSNDDFSYPRIVMQKAYLKCLSPLFAPVHINVPIREPLIPNLNAIDFSQGRIHNLFQYFAGIRKIKENFCSEWNFLSQEKGVIICGGDANSDYQKDIVRLGERLNVPILADPLSNLRNLESQVIIDSYDAFLNESFIAKELIPDYVLLFGQPPISKRVKNFLELNNKIKCIQIDEVAEYRNPSLNTCIVVETAPKDFIEKITFKNDNKDFLYKWLYYQKNMRKKINMVKKETALFEGKIIQIIRDIIPSNGRLVAANSMTIRDIDYFWEAHSGGCKILCNRGTNGIDGTISTALGVAVDNDLTVLLTGDLAFFHDMNGLLIGKTHNLKLVIVLFNNNGGGIFHYLPQKGERYFEYLFSTPHNLQFSGLEAMYGIKYFKISDYDSFEKVFIESINSLEKNIYLIEVKTDKNRSWELHQKYTKWEERKK